MDTLAELSNFRNIITRIYELLLPFRKCYTWPQFFVHKTTFLSLRNQQALPGAKEYSSFSSHFYPKTLGDNRSSEQIFTETVCWVGVNFQLPCCDIYQYCPSTLNLLPGACFAFVYVSSHYFELFSISSPNTAC